MPEHDSNAPPKAPVRTVLFDFDGTLVFQEPDRFDVLRAFFAEIGQPLSPEAERRGRRAQHEYFVDPEIRDQVDSLSPEDFWRHFIGHVVDALGVVGDRATLIPEVLARLADSEHSYTCPADGCQTLAELRERGYQLGLVTNRQHVERFHELLDEFELRPWFDLILASGEVGIRKPEPGIFGVALEQMQAQAQESLYIGDNYWADVVGARQAGLTPVLLDPHQIFAEADCLLLHKVSDLLTLLPERKTL